MVTDRLLAALAAAVNEVGGHVDKLTGDGIMALFGAPTSHEDDPQRAVLAAARMQEALRRLVVQETGGGRQLGLRVGLNTGEVLAGVQASLSYTVVGDTVNTASRLSDAAGVGAVVAGQETALATMDVAAWRALPPLRLKGKRDPVSAYELVGLRPEGAGRVGIGDQAPFLGRDAEFGLLVGRLLDVIDSGEPSSVVVLGEAGVGKTRLVEETGPLRRGDPRLAGAVGPLPPLRRAAVTSRRSWTWCAPRVGLDPDAVDLRRRGGPAVARARRTIERLLEQGPIGPGAAAPSRRPLGARRPAARAARRGGGHHAPGCCGSPPPARCCPRTPRVEAVLALLNALAADGPLVLVVDDVQWASARACATCSWPPPAGWTGPVLVIGIARPELLEQRPDRVAGAAPGRAAAARPAGARRGGPAAARPPRRHARRPVARAPCSTAPRATRSSWPSCCTCSWTGACSSRGEDGTWSRRRRAARRRPAGRGAGGAQRPDRRPRPGAKARAARRGGGRLAGSTRPRWWRSATAASRRSAAGLRDPGRSGSSCAPRRSPAPRGARRAYSFAHTLARDVAYGSIPKAERARRHAAVAPVVARAPAESVPERTADADDLTAWQAERAVELATEMGLPPDDPAWAARGPRRPRRWSRLGTARAGPGQQRRGRGHAGPRARAGRGGRRGRRPALDRRRALRAARVARGRALAVLHRLDEAEDDARPPGAGRSRPTPPAGPAALLGLGEVRRRQGRDDEPALLFDRLLTGAAAPRPRPAPGRGAARRSGCSTTSSGRLGGRRGAVPAGHEPRACAPGTCAAPGWALQQLAWSSTTRGDYADRRGGARRRAGGLRLPRGHRRAVLERRHRGPGAAAAGPLLPRPASSPLGLLPLGEAMGDVWGIAACRLIDGYAAVELGDVSERAGQRARRRGARPSPPSATPGAAPSRCRGGLGAPGGRPARRRAGRCWRRPGRARSGPAPRSAGCSPAPPAATACSRPATRPGPSARPRQALAMLDGVDLEPHAALSGRRSCWPRPGARPRATSPGRWRCSTGRPRRERRPSLLFPRRQALAHLAGTLLEAGRADEALAVAQPGGGARPPRTSAARCSRSARWRRRWRPAGDLQERPRRPRPRRSGARRHRAAGRAGRQRGPAGRAHRRGLTAGPAQRARRPRRSRSSRTTERASSRSQPREAKSARALFTVSRLAPDELGELLLGEAVLHPQAVALLGAEAGAEVGQRLGHPAGHVREHEVGHRVVGAPQPAGQHLQQPLADLGVAGDPRAAGRCG